MIPFVFCVFFSHIFPTKTVTKYWKALKQKGILALNLRLPKFKTEKKVKNNMLETYPVLMQTSATVENFITIINGWKLLNIDVKVRILDICLSPGYTFAYPIKT